MRLSLDLDQAWRDLVTRGAMKYAFTDRSGRTVEAGVRIGSAGPESYAVDAATRAEVCEAAELVRLPNGMEVLYNPVGKLKPHVPPSRSGRQPGIPADPAECPFACQNPANPLSILHRPSLAEIPCPDRRWSAYPNVAPWEPRGLFIWLPCPPDAAERTLPHYPQILHRDGLEDFLAIAQSASGLATFFNSLHGGASANHLHFQSVWRHRQLACESAARRNVGSYSFLAGYPATGLVFPLDVPADSLWEAIARIQTAQYPFNLIALSSGIFLFVRNPANEILDEFPGRAFGAINFAGLFISSDPMERAKVTDAAIASAYTKLTVSTEELISLVL